ncbi:transaldolase [Nocardioides sp. AN3]
MSASSDDRLAAVSAAGVSIWLDDLSRERLRSGSLAELVRSHHVVGVTTNPAIFRGALSNSAAYADHLRELASMKATPEEAVRALTTYDVRWACDVLRPVFDATDGRDGYVSIEVDPRSAHETEATVAEAKALRWLVDRPNVLIKIPATDAGLRAIADVLAEGISVNVTLIFSLTRYREVIDAFLTGLERAQANGHDLAQIASVASFFVSRLDSDIDARLEQLGRSGLGGKAGLANARLAYECFLSMLGSQRWAALEALGARPQRPLWASTGVKNPAYDDTMYVVGLAAEGCVNTMPEATLLAVADHGQVERDTITDELEASARVLTDLAAAGIDYATVVAGLEDAAVRLFEEAWTALLGSVSEQLRTGVIQATP